MPWQMLFAHSHPQAIVSEVLAKLQDQSGQSMVDLTSIRQLVARVRDPKSMRHAFSVAQAEKLAKNPPDVSNGLVHVHIMKTAGTSFFESLRSATHEDSIWVNFDVLATLPHDIRGSVFVISGHFPYEARKLIGQDRKYLTILREPRERTLSHFNEVLNILDNDRSSHLPSLEEFLWCERWAGLASNYQTRQLGFEVGVETLGIQWSATAAFSTLGDPFPSQHPFPLCSFFDSVLIPDWSDVFSRASHTVGSIDIILTTELLHLAPEIVNHVADLDLGPIPRLNERDYSGFRDLPQRLRDRIDAINECDAELWRMARKRTLNIFAETNR